MKVRVFAAEGLELPVSTDHDRLTDYQPVIESLHLGERLKSFIGEEISTNLKGHFNAFPLILRPDLPNAGAVVWYKKLVPDIVALAHEGNEGDELVQMNHPRGSSAHFDYIEFDPSWGGSRHPEFTTAFDAIEVFNGKRKGDTEEVIQDWYSLLNRGVVITATGNSDSHKAAGKEEAGYPRTYVRFPGVTSIKDVTKKMLIDGIRGGNVTICGGPFVTLEANGKPMGSIVDASAGSLELRIVVQAPSWVDVDRVALIENGIEVGAMEEETIVIGGSLVAGKQVLTFSRRPMIDSWYIALAEGDGDLGPVVLSSNALSFTNPVFADVDGNGRFDPPNPQ